MAALGCLRRHAALLAHWGVTCAPSVQPPLRLALTRRAGLAAAAVVEAVAAAEPERRGKTAGDAAASTTTADASGAETSSRAAGRSRRKGQGPADEATAPARSGGAAATTATAGAPGAPAAAPGGPLPARVVLLGIDPDSSGAVAVLSWGRDALVAAGQGDAGPPPSAAALRRARAAEAAAACGGAGPSDAARGEAWQVAPGAQPRVQLYDMLLITHQLPPSKKGGPARTRKRMDVDAAVRLVRQIVAEHAPPGMDGHGRSGSNSGSNCGGGGVVLRAYLEVAAIRPTNGTFAIQNLGFTVGAFHGLLRSAGVDLVPVSVATWKRDLGLVGQDKDGDRALAAAALPAAAGLVSRVKDHGRADALLIAAWGAGLVPGRDGAAPRWGPPRRAAVDSVGHAVATNTWLWTGGGGGSAPIEEAQPATRRKAAAKQHNGASADGVSSESGGSGGEEAGGATSDGEGAAPAVSGRSRRGARNGGGGGGSDEAAKSTPASRARAAAAGRKRAAAAGEAAA